MNAAFPPFDTRRPLFRRLSVFLLMGSAWLCVPSIVPAEMTLQMIGLPAGLSTEEGIIARVQAGQNLQWFLGLEDGTLLDPASVRVTWRGEDLPSTVYYTSPNFALVFAALAGQATAREGELFIRATPIGDQVPVSSVISLSFPFDPRDAAQQPVPGSETVRVVDEEGKPIPSARLFGQLRADLFGVANGEGLVILDAPTRSTPDLHYAWAPGFWTEAFDPRETAQIQLRPLPSGPVRDRLVRSADLLAVPRTARAAVTDSTGEGIGGALVWADRTWWSITQPDGRFTTVIPEGREDSEVVILAPGYGPTQASVPLPDERTAYEGPPHIVLQSSQARAGAE